MASFESLHQSSPQVHSSAPPAYSTYSLHPLYTSSLPTYSTLYLPTLPNNSSQPTQPLRSLNTHLYTPYTHTHDLIYLSTQLTPFHPFTYPPHSTYLLYSPILLTHFTFPTPTLPKPPTCSSTQSPRTHPLSMPTLPTYLTHSTHPL